MRMEKRPNSGLLRGNERTTLSRTKHFSFVQFIQNPKHFIYKTNCEKGGNPPKSGRFSYLTINTL